MGALRNQMGYDDKSHWLDGEWSYHGHRRQSPGEHGYVIEKFGKLKWQQVTLVNLGLETRYMPKSVQIPMVFRSERFWILKAITSARFKQMLT